MFPYRRHGSKKRVKHGPGRNHPPRAPQKGLPNSARDLLPLLQPATKALAHMLGGRTPSSGQLGHARALLAHAERLIGERQHNRLNPGEREEFFEQLARLKLTLADAESEAELQAAEDQAPPRPVAQPVARERLKELALALASPEARATATPESGEGGEPGAEAAVPVPDAARPEVAAARGDQLEDAPEAADTDAAPRPSRPPGRLGLSEVAAREAASALTSAPVRRPATSRRKRLMPLTERAPSGDESDREPAERTGDAPQAGARNGAPAARPEEESPEPRAGSAGRRLRPAPKKTQKGLPEGWVIDEDGFVVPGAS